MKYRIPAAMLALTGVYLPAYLYLYKIGRIGSLACGTGSCEQVQFSSWARFVGVEVSLIGVLGYFTLLVIALVAVRPELERVVWPGRWLAALSGAGVLFTIYLTSVELFVLHAICRWCVGSAVIITLIFLLSLLDLRRLRAGRG